MRSDQVQIFPIDSTTKNCTFKVPLRWYVIDVSNQSVKLFLNKRKYQDYLKLKNISGKMYNSKDYQEQFYKTGLLPWFPDEIRKKILAKK